MASLTAASREGINFFNHLPPLIRSQIPHDIKEGALPAHGDLYVKKVAVLSADELTPPCEYGHTKDTGEPFFLFTVSLTHAAVQNILQNKTLMIRFPNIQAKLSKGKYKSACLLYREGTEWNLKLFGTLFPLIHSIDQRYGKDPFVVFAEIAQNRHSDLYLVKA